MSAYDFEEPSYSADRVVTELKIFIAPARPAVPRVANVPRTERVALILAPKQQKKHMRLHNQPFNLTNPTLMDSLCCMLMGVDNGSQITVKPTDDVFEERYDEYLAKLAVD
ncbi:hypothetical protein IFR05_001010 [Cadophora sp. M221]|nr:hypothetical protein IFR05_001010 [Cadophora sp. M221]